MEGGVLFFPQSFVGLRALGFPRDGGGSGSIGVLHF